MDRILESIDVVHGAARQLETTTVGFPIPGHLPIPKFSGLQSANPGIPVLIPGLGVSKKTAYLLAYKFLQVVFFSVM